MIQGLESGIKAAIMAKRKRDQQGAEDEVSSMNGDTSKAEEGGREEVRSSSSNDQQKEAIELFMLAIKQGAVLGWAKEYLSDPWWPALITRSWSILRMLPTKTPLPADKGMIHENKRIAYFLSHNKHQEVERGWVEEGFMRKYPKPEMMVKEHYQPALMIAKHLEKKWSELDPQEMEKISQALASGVCTMVQAWGIDSSFSDTSSSVSSSAVTWSPALAFRDMEGAQSLGLPMESKFKKRSLMRGDTCVFLIGSWLPPRNRWHIIRRSTPFSIERAIDEKRLSPKLQAAIAEAKASLLQPSVGRTRSSLLPKQSKPPLAPSSLRVKGVVKTEEERALYGNGGGGAVAAAAVTGDQEESIGEKSVESSSVMSAAAEGRRRVTRSRPTGGVSLPLPSLNHWRNMAPSPLSLCSSTMSDDGSSTGGAADMMKGRHQSTSTSREPSTPSLAAADFSGPLLPIPGNGTSEEDGSTGLTRGGEEKERGKTTTTTLEGGSPILQERAAAFSYSNTLNGILSKPALSTSSPSAMINGQELPTMKRKRGRPPRQAPTFTAELVLKFPPPSLPPSQRPHRTLVSPPPEASSSSSSSQLPYHLHQKKKPTSSSSSSSVAAQQQEPSPMRSMTPEEVEKIRRLAEGLLYMGEVAKQSDGGALLHDLNALRLFIIQGTSISPLTLSRLERGLRAYVGRMRAQLQIGQRDYETFQARTGEGMVGLDEVYGELHKDLKRVVMKMEEHTACLKAQSRAIKKKKGFGSIASEAHNIYARVQASLKSLHELKEAVSEPCLKKTKLDEALVEKAGVVFKLGVEVTQDQIAAAEHLLRACEDFRLRLLRKMQQLEKERGRAKTAVASTNSDSSLRPPALKSN